MTTAMLDPSDANREDYRATYCPEDDKIRLYTDRVERSTYLWLRSLKFQATPKQDCSFVAVWSPAAEDAALAMIHEDDDIGDEDQSPEDRAADRAERFSGYRDKRRSEAHRFADRYEAGPSAYGHQNAQRAERMAARRDRIGGRACSQWAKAEYWQHRTAGVISNALHRSDARTRRGRILTLEAEKRRVEASYTPHDGTPDIMRPARWDGTGEPIPHCWVGPKGRGGRWVPRAALDNIKRQGQRYLDHLELRLAYERQMLEADGGTAADAEMVPGGMLGRYLITKVNKSPATGAVVSVNVYAPKQDGEGWDYRRRGDTMLLNVQRMAQHVYSPPTDESLAKLAEVTNATKAKAKKANAGKPKLINPTPEDAEKLQAELNRIASDAIAKRYGARDFTPTPVVYMTQVEYSARSGGTYSRFSTQYLHRTDSGVLTLDNRLSPIRGGSHVTGWACLAKVRTGPRTDFYSPEAIIVITDKPKKPLPDWTPATVEAETVNA